VDKIETITTFRDNRGAALPRRLQVLLIRNIGSYFPEAISGPVMQKYVMAALPRGEVLPDRSTTRRVELGAAADRVAKPAPAGELCRSAAEGIGDPSIPRRCNVHESFRAC
jgi:hypothetical protein